MVLRQIFFFALVSAADGAEVRPPCVSVETLYYPAETRKILAEADSLQVATLRAKFPKARDPHDFEDVVIKESLSGAQRETLLRLIFADATYSWPETVLPDGTIRGRRISWIPSWDVCVRAKRGSEVVEVYFSFFHMVTVRRGGAYVNAAFMGPKSDELLAFFLSMFPDDERLLQEEKQRAFWKRMRSGGK